MIIYKTTNLVNGKIYVGKDIHDDINYFGSGILLERAIKKYGKYNFKKEIIQKCLSIEELNIQEIYWIDKLNSCDRNVGYNIAIGGDGGDTISNHPDRERIIENFRKRKHAVMTEEIKRKISMANTGKKASPETIKKLSLSHKGLFCGEKNPMYGKPAWSRGKKMTPEQKKNMYGEKNGKTRKTKPQIYNLNRMSKKYNRKQF